MALTSSVAPNTPILSAWGNEIRDRTVQQFPDQANLQAQWPDAPNGAVAITLDRSQLWIKRAGGGTGWQLANTSRGIRSSIWSPNWFAVPDMASGGRWGIGPAFSLFTGRLYSVTFTMRQQGSAVAAGGGTLGGTLLLDGPDPDQEVCAWGHPVTQVAPAVRFSVNGMFFISGPDNGNAAVQFIYEAYANAAGNVQHSTTGYIVADAGPYPSY